MKILGWGIWANFLQRHICSDIQNTFDFIQNRWGVRDEAVKYAASCDKAFNKLYLYPFVRRYNAVDGPSFRKAVDDAFVVTTTMPHLSPPACWNALCWPGPKNEEYRPNPNPHVNEWHKHNPPPGSVYNPEPRMYHPSLTDRGDSLRWFEKLNADAPYSRVIADALIDVKYKKNATFEQLQEIYRPMMDFCVGAIARSAEKIRNNPELYEKMMLRAAEGHPSYYFSLWQYFVKTDENKAARYCLQGYEKLLDRVGAAEHAGWLVDYFLKNKQVDKAREIADEAGEVYSYSGLCAKASFFEQTAQYQNALEWYKKIQERYDDSGPLGQFCSRYKAKTGKTDLDGVIAGFTSNLFPKGMEKVSLATFKGAPTDGVLVVNDNDLVLQAGMKAGDVIVALNGTRVHDMPQYSYLREQLPSPEMKFIVWDGGGYRETTANLPDHRFHVDFETYVKK